MDSPIKNHFVVLNDEPIADNGDDLLGRSDTADRLADLIVASRGSTPFTLAIDAGWGMGKSSLMRQIQRRIDQTDGMHSVWFNAWTSGTDALEVLIKSVFLHFDRNILRRAYNRVVANNRASGISRVVLALTMSLLGLPRLIDALWSQMSVDAKRRNEIQEVVRQMAQDWAKNPRTLGQQIVVFIDDLDRCTDETVLAVCEAIKLYLDVPGLIFIVGCDQAALLRKLNQPSPTGVRAAEYLEKIIQVNYHAPLPETQQVHDLVAGYASRSGTHQMFSDELSSFITERTGRNPRRIKRLINSFILEYQLDSEWQMFGANILVRILLLQHFYPEFYRLLASPSAHDPVREFLDYRDVRMSVRSGAARPEEWHDLFRSYGISPPASEGSRERLAQSLEELEHEVPEEFLGLVADTAFCSTLQQLKNFADFDALRRHLQRLRRIHLLPSDITGSGENSYLPGERADLRGVRVLMVDDVFGLDSINSGFTDTGQVGSTIREWGAEVAMASDLAAIERELRRFSPDVIISDINRNGNENAGLDDLAELRNRNLYHGPVVFYVARVTSTRRARAADLGAIGVTNNSVEVLEWVRMAVGR